MRPDSGLVTTARPLEGRAGTYSLTVEARDGGAPSLVGRALVSITVTENNNMAPRWVWPVFDNQTLHVLEVSVAVSRHRQEQAGVQAHTGSNACVFVCLTTPHHTK